MSALLSVDNLEIRTPGRTLVSGISFSIAAGERVGLIGESGSGKSLTALAMLGLLPEPMRVAGSILLDGHQVIGTRDRDLVPLRGTGVAVVFQEPMTALDPLMRIGHQVGEVVRRRAMRDGIACGREEVSRRVLGLLERVALPEADRIARAFPHEISGGQRQRAAIAMALACRPKLLIADEPTTALDVTTQMEILKLLEGLVQDEAMGLLFISHDLPVVASIATRALVMRGGRLIEEGPVAALFNRPAHPYTGSLVAAARAFDAALEMTQ
ncbi:ABC transporter ATP-binding protein [Rhizobium sp. Root73]|uniref:ATP-binding cassette domain-containing protein n=1 Tax=unclassified Rhizobium TaxID=2613769 RepID=UPI000723ADDF|nr:MULTISPECIES: ABC transporter ATP-binding protein [unclassified Rhizobium]KQY16351.1 ABC transporter ATP-binding protein [Rhizobium sp. Root1334]KRC12728.1 ABC transporter ATP-binding protein [Rhizobium sp. Root73]